MFAGAKRSRMLFEIVTLAVLGLGTTSCGDRDLSGAATEPADHDPDRHGIAMGLVDEQCTAGLESFRTTVHPLIRNRCVACHDQQTNPGPRFAVESAEESYATVVRYQDFDNVAGSRFVRTGGNNHCFNDYQYPCNTSAAELQAAVTAWWDGGENSCPRRGKFFSLPRKLPPSLPDRSHGFVRLRWDLSGVSALFRNVFFEMEGQRFAAGTPDSPETLRFRKPRLISPTRTVRIRDVKVLVNGMYDALSDGYRRIDTTIAPQGPQSDPVLPSGAPVLSTEALFVFNSHGGDPDIMVSFEALNSAAAETCHALPEFTSMVLPGLQARGCAQCHGGGGQAGRAPANQVFNMNVDDAALCNAVRQRMSKSGLSSSPAVAYPLRGVNGHPRMFLDEAEADAVFGAWFRAEAMQ